MEGLVKLSFYCFTAATIALAGSTICYLLFAAGRVRVRRSAMATPEGATFTSTTAEFAPGSETFRRFATMLLWFTVFFSGLRGADPLHRSRSRPVLATCTSFRSASSSRSR